MKVLFIFLDGVGLGEDDPEINPLVRAPTPNLDSLLDGQKIIANGHHPSSRASPILLHNGRISLLALDACLMVEGLPQSASGQASLMTGKNVAGMLGAHDGPKPSLRIMEILKKGTLFSQVIERRRKARLLNAYPPRYFQSIENGYRIPGVIALSASYAGVHLQTKDDLFRGEAISTDFTAQGWREHLGFGDTPLLSPQQAGERLFTLAKNYDVAFFEYWLTDVAGHHQDMPTACELLELIDKVMGNLARSWDGDQGIILLTSDHGNLEDLSTRHHTRNDVPLLLLGSQAIRETFITELLQVRRSKEQLDLTDITPAVLNLL